MNWSLVIAIIPVKAQCPLGHSKGAVSASPCPHCPWVTAWVICPLLAAPKASAGPCCALGAHWCFWHFYMLLHSTPQHGALGCLIHSLKWELCGSVCVTVSTSCFLELIFFQSVVLSISFLFQWYEKQSQWREGHALGSIYMAVHLLKQALFAQVFKFFGAGTIPLHRFEPVLR